MKKIILFLLVLLICVPIFCKTKNDCDTEGTKLIYYIPDEKIIDLYNRTDIQTIGENAFCNKTAEELILPKYALYFEKYSISRNNKLKVLNLPSFVQIIEDNAFWGNSFEEINVLTQNFKNTKEKNDYFLGLGKAMKLIKKSYVFPLEDEEADNPVIKSIVSRKLYDLAKIRYISKEGVLYTYPSYKLVAYPAKKKDTEFIIPDGTLEIADGAFYHCANLKLIFVPDTVRKIGDKAFEGNKDLVLHVSENSQGYKYCIENKIKYELEEKLF